jgi:hypothetical protein
MTTTGPAPADANSPPPPAPDYPPLPKLISSGWVTPPPLLPPDSNDPERLALREVNHHSYQQSGNKLTWYHYVLFGYYLFDSVEDFERAWNNESNNQLARFRIMWDSFHKNRMSKVDSSPLLTTWAINYAKPYLHQHEPDYLLATEILYDDCIDNEAEKPPAAPEQSWKEIGHNRRGKTTHQGSPPLSPRSISPTTTSDYYEPLQNDDLEMDMQEDNDEEVQIIDPSPPVNATQENSNTIRPEASRTSSLPKTNTQRTSPAIRLRNPYRNKNKPRNPTFAKHLRDFLRARPPKDDTREWPAPPHPTQSPTALNASKNHWEQNNTEQPTTTTNTTIPDISTAASNKPHGSGNTVNSTSNTTYQPPDPFVLINDGTQRLTIRWRPDLYDGLESDPNSWDKEMTTVLQHLFHEHNSRTAIVKWGEQYTPETNTLLAEITHDRIRQFLSPNISHLKTNKTFIFGLRLCAPDNHLNVWITRESTREILRNNKMEITLSNSKSTSGNVVTAGYILMKHPTYTQRYFYLLSLRKALPNNTPFFDLAIHRRTPHGATIPHLVVKCGENHITALSEILSAYLDGRVRNTALFVASPAVKSMTQEEIAHMFTTHTNFTDSLQRLSLYPRVINIDRERQEQYGTTNLSRSTRDWARSLKTDEGQPLRCDAENGGPDRRAYLLVSTPHLERAKIELQRYLQAIQQTNQNQFDLSSDRRTNITDHTRPNEIYIPTPAVLQNLNFLNSLTAEEVWKGAPQSIRTPPTAKQPVRPGNPTTPAKQPTYNPTVPVPFSYATQSQTVTPSTTGAQSHASALDSATQRTLQHQTQDEYPHLTAIGQPEHRQDDTTVGTTTSNFTRTTHNQNQSIHNARFQELEAQIQSHQNEFKDIHARFDHLNEQLLRNMNIASTHSAQFSQLERQFSEMNKAIQILLLRTPENQKPNDSSAIISQLQNTPRQPPATIHPSDTTNQHTHTTTEISTPTSSPEKKRIRQTNEASYPHHDAQEQSAQYKESTPADFDK